MHTKLIDRITTENTLSTEVPCEEVNWFATAMKESFWIAIVLQDTEHTLPLFFLRIVGGWKTVSPHKQSSSYGLFMANRIVRVKELGA